MKEYKPIPQGKKIYRWEDLPNLPVSSDGVLRVDGIVMGPNEKWWIDEEGNAYFAGEMTVEKDVDPQYIQLQSSSSAPSGINPLSLWVSSSASPNVLKYRDSSGLNDNNVPVGTVSGDHPVAHTDINHYVVPPTGSAHELSTSWAHECTVSVTPSSVDSRIFLSACWTCWCDLDTHTPYARLYKSSALASYTSQDAGTSGSGAAGYSCGGLFYVDSPNTTSSVTYYLDMYEPALTTINVLHTSLVVFECLDATA